MKVISSINEECALGRANALTRILSGLQVRNLIPARPKIDDGFLPIDLFRFDAYPRRGEKKKSETEKSTINGLQTTTRYSLRLHFRSIVMWMVVSDMHAGSLPFYASCEHPVLLLQLRPPARICIGRRYSLHCVVGIRAASISLLGYKRPLLRANSRRRALSKMGTLSFRGAARATSSSAFAQATAIRRKIRSYANTGRYERQWL